MKRIIMKKSDQLGYLQEHQRNLHEGTFSQESVTVRVSTERVIEIDIESIQYLLSILNNKGLVLIELTPSTDEQIALENLTALSGYFGDLEVHKHAKAGVVDITTKPDVYTDGVRRPQSDNGRQSPHSDGSFGRPPSVIALCCLQSAIRGGEGLVVDMQNVFQYMLKEHPQKLVTLFNPHATKVVRGNVSANQPVFMYGKGRIRACFSNHEYNHVIVSEHSQEGFALIDAYIKDSAHQGIIVPRVGQIAIYDNFWILHGRREFTDLSGRERYYKRAWYNGDSDYIRQNPRGFFLNPESDKLLSLLLANK